MYWPSESAFTKPPWLAKSRQLYPKSRESLEAPTSSTAAVGFAPAAAARGLRASLVYLQSAAFQGEPVDFCDNSCHVLTGPAFHDPESARAPALVVPHHTFQRHFK